MLPLVGLACAGFIFNTSEIVPIGLLTDIATDFGVSEARAGLLITVYAWVVATMSLPLMLLCAKMDYRRLLLGIVGLFFISHIASGLAPGYWSLMASRIGVACAHSLFWSVAPPLAVLVAPGGNRPMALSAMVAGGAVAMIVGLPLGRVIGLVAGWRTTFMTIGGITGLLLLFLLKVFPHPAHSGDMDSRRQMLGNVLGNRALLILYVVTAVIVTGHYTCYTYIEPFMDQVAHMQPMAITLTLSLFGFAGIGGSWVMQRYFVKAPRVLILAACFGMPAMMALLLPSAGTVAVLVAVGMAWGMSMTVFNIAFQNEIILLAPHNSAVAMSIYSGIFNLGIGGGAFVGGYVCTYSGVGSVGLFGAAISLAAALLCCFRLLPRLLHP